MKKNGNVVMCFSPHGALHELDCFNFSLDVLYVPNVVNKLSYCVITLRSSVTTCLSQTER